MVAGKLSRKDKTDLGDKQDAAAYLSTCMMSLGDRVEDHRSVRATDSLRADYSLMAETFWSVEEVTSGDNLEVVDGDEAVAG